MPSRSDVDTANERLRTALTNEAVTLLPPLDAGHCMSLLSSLRIQATMTMLDPWYNKGVGGVREDYRDFVLGLLRQASDLSDHVYLWGFPEIVAQFVERIPDPLTLNAWLTWYYKNNPSVIRGWRSSQMACLHMTTSEATLHPEHFLNEKQMELKARGKLRYMPGPTSVIEAALLVGFVGRSEQTGHPSQKPVAVYEKLVLMATVTDDLVVDPMCGSGTTGKVCQKLSRRAILCDYDEEYVAMVEKRLGMKRIDPGLVSTVLSGLEGD